MADIIDIDEARRKRHRPSGSFAHLGAAANLASVERLRRLSEGCAQVQELVFESLEVICDLGGTDAIDRLSERLILQIASRVTVERGRDRALEMLANVAVGTIEIESRDDRQTNELES